MAKQLTMLRALLLLGLVTALLGCASTSTQESTGQYVDDSVITTKVKAEILNEATLKTFQISVETYKGAVQLSGFVDSPQSVNKAGEVARRVRGVVSVRNNLIVK